MSRTTAALTLAAIAVVLSIIAVVLAVIALGRTPADAPAPPPAPPAIASPRAEPGTTEPLTDMADADPNSTRLEYEIDTDGMSVTSISYVGWDDDQPKMIDKDGAPAPFRQIVDVPKGSDLADFSITGVGGSTSRIVRCTIRVDGAVVATQEASGAYAVTSCSAKGAPAP